MGYGFGYNGTIGETTYPGTVDLTNGPVDVSIFYADGQLALTFSNELSTAMFSTLIYVGSIPQDLGPDTAYVGFTGAFGGDNSIQIVQNFQFVSLPPQAIQVAGNNAIITWPGSIEGPFMVQHNVSITSTNWVTLTTPCRPWSMARITPPVPTGGSNLQFYRLILSQP